MLRFLNLAPQKSIPASKGRTRPIERVTYGSHVASPEGGRHKLLEIAEQIGDANIWGALDRHLRLLGEEISSPVLAHYVAVCPIPYLRWWAIEELQERGWGCGDSGHRPELIIVPGRHDCVMGHLHDPHQGTVRTTVYGRTDAQREKRRSKGN